MLNTNAKKWLAALRSGEYTKGTKDLHANGNFCALGVACDVAVKNQAPINVTQDSQGRSMYNGKICVPPRELRVWLGLSFSGEDKIMELNDGLDKTFVEIADAIEAEPEKFFA